MRILSFLIVIFLFVYADDFAQSQHGENFDIDCSFCHDVSSWNVDLKKVTFDHTNTGFALIGQHNNVSCRSCHSTLIFSEAASDCISCHKDIHAGTTGADCSVCHTSDSWIVKDIVNLHQTGRFPLTGGHKTADCIDCHSGYADLNFQVLGLNCIDCHSTDYFATLNPDHVSAGFSTDCYDCHSIKSLTWNTINLDHNFFPLVGGHSITNCFTCHAQGSNFTGLSAECFSCHESDYNATQNPNHIQAGFSTDCNQCHTIYSFIPASFDHNLTNFPLTGRHITVNCTLCHTSGYSGTPTECVSCHLVNYNSTSNPNHISAGFPTTCNDCHSTSAWQPAQFDHDGSYFPIYSGKHKDKWNNCSDCHTIQNNFSIFSCIDCHEHRKSEMDDEHSGINGYVYESTACLSCHPTGRKEGAFNHNNTDFILEGAHKSAECSQCHQSGYAGTTTNCFDCHNSDYTSSSNPNHNVLSIPADCKSCHSTNPGWSPASFPIHNEFFVLTGRHLEVANDCNSCHSGNYSTTQNLCIGCHQAAYNNAQNPNHTASGIPSGCSDCHSTIAWIPSSFDHITTGFQLTGQHQLQDCSSCHNGTTGGLIGECFFCHSEQFAAAPNHLQQNLPTNCEICHNTSQWMQITFNHQLTGFVLTGAHLTAECISCHESGYAGTNTECFGCHSGEYNSTTSPNHASVGFPVLCQDCHSTNSWLPAQFDHDGQYFPIYSGKHKDKWTSCLDCHRLPNNYSIFSCIDCHEHNQQSMNNDHSEVTGYVYESTACLSCHPNGNNRNMMFEMQSGFEFRKSIPSIQRNGINRIR